MSSKQNTIEIICYIVGAAVGAFFILVGLSILSGDIPSRYVSHYEFGADFYTEIYYAARMATCALSDIYELLSKALSWFFILFGAADICFFAGRAFGIWEENEAKAGATMKDANDEDELPEI